MFELQSNDEIIQWNLFVSKRNICCFFVLFCLFNWNHGYGLFCDWFRFSHSHSVFISHHRNLYRLFWFTNHQSRFCWFYDSLLFIKNVNIYGIREISSKNISVHSEENGVINWDLELMTIMINIFFTETKTKTKKTDKSFDIHTRKRLVRLKLIWRLHIL